MTAIIPAIMPHSLEDLKAKVSLVAPHVDTIQIDLMDGEYVEGKTWPFFPKDKDDVSRIFDGEMLPFSDKVKYEFDLMVKGPEADLRKFVKLGADRLIIHANSIENRELFEREIGKVDVEWGIAFLATDNISAWSSVLEKAYFVQVMGIEEIGKQGEPFSEKTFEQIQTIRVQYPNVILSVDGGVNLENAQRLKDAGVARLVSGSTIFNTEDTEGVINQLRNG